MNSHDQPTPSGDRNIEQQPELIDGSPWQEDEMWEPSGPGVLSGSDRAQESPTDELKRKAGRSAGQAKQALQEIGSLAAEKSALAGQKLREYGGRAFNEQKERAAEEIGVVSSAIRRTADNLYAERDENLAEYVEAAAEQIDRIERYLRSRSPGAMYSDLQGIARRRPEMVAGGMFIAGVALARFLKASRPDQSVPGRRASAAFTPSGLAAGPLVSPHGEPVTPPLYPSPVDIDNSSGIEPGDKTPEVESWKPE